ncbi:MAG: hypothetical protein AAGL98_12675, partial [Planctomycetota bacterium]
MSPQASAPSPDPRTAHDTAEAASPREVLPAAVSNTASVGTNTHNAISRLIHGDRWAAAGKT